LEKLVLRLEKKNVALMKENQSLRASISSSQSSSSSTKRARPSTSTSSAAAKTATPSALTRELLDRIESTSSSESAAFSKVLPQQERTAAWVRRQLLLRLSTATRCFTCLIALMMTSSLKSRMLLPESQDTQSRKGPLTPQEKRLLLRLHMTNQSLVSCCHQQHQEDEATCWWGPQQQSWNPARISAAEA